MAGVLLRHLDDLLYKAELDGSDCPKAANGVVIFYVHSRMCLMLMKQSVAGLL